ncbi:MAG: tyrosine-type recombinase/integrase [Tepidibacillus sp.]
MGASIDKIGKKFRITYDYGKDANGKRIRKFQTVDTKAEAERLVADFKYKQQRNQLVMKNDITLADHLKNWMDFYVAVKCQETTAYGYRNVIENHLIPYMGYIKLQDLHPALIQKYYKHLIDKDYSPNTVHRHHAVLRKALDFAQKQQYVYENVADRVELPKKEKYEGKSYTAEQMKILLEKVKGTKLELPVYLAACLGLRREEIMGLRWENVDLEQQVLYIVEVRTAAGNNNNIIKAPKTEGSRRKLYIIDELKEILINHKEKQARRKELLGDLYYDSDYVFVRDDGKPYRVNSVTEQFKDFLEKHNLPIIRLHDLRHTFASVMHHKGATIKDIAEMMGHSDTSTTSRIYTHLFDNTHKEKLSIMSKILSS